MFLLIFIQIDTEGKTVYGCVPSFWISDLES